MTTLDQVLDQAKLFDDEFVKTISYDLYCASETLIRSYLIAKAVVTDDLCATIIANPYELNAVIANFKDVLVKSGLDKNLKRQKSSTKDDTFVFKNRSFLHFSPYDQPVQRFKDTRMHIMYARNSALESLFPLNNIENFENMIMAKTRMIYNFEQ